MDSSFGMFTAFLVVTSLSGVAFVIWYLLRPARRLIAQAKRDDAERGRLVKPRGRRYEEIPKGDVKHRIFGRSPAQVDWTIEYDSDAHSSSSSPKLYFRAARLKTPGIAWYMMGAFAFKAPRGIGSTFVASAALALIAKFTAKTDDLKQFVDRAREVPIGSARLRERFKLMSLTGSTAALFDAEVERLILDWPDFSPSVTKRDNCIGANQNAAGLEVHIACKGPGFAVVTHLAPLGEALADRLARSASMST